MEAQTITINKIKIERAIKLLEQLDVMIQATLAGRGYFLLPLQERGNELESLGKAVALRLADLKNDAILASPGKVERVVAAISDLFNLVADYVQEGDALPPDDAGMLNTLLFLLRDTLKD